MRISDEREKRGGRERERKLSPAVEILLGKSARTDWHAPTRGLSLGRAAAASCWYVRLDAWTNGGERSFPFYVRAATDGGDPDSAS